MFEGQEPAHRAGDKGENVGALKVRILVDQAARHQQDDHCLGHRNPHLDRHYFLLVFDTYNLL